MLKVRCVKNILASTAAVILFKIRPRHGFKKYEQDPDYIEGSFHWYRIYFLFSRTPRSELSDSTAG